MYMHKQWLYTCAILVCMCSYATVTYLTFYIIYNATITATAVAQFFTYRAWATLYHAVEEDVVDEVNQEA